MSYSKVITTKKGERYLQGLIISGETLTFTKIVTSTRNYTEEDAKELPGIENINKRFRLIKRKGSKKIQFKSSVHYRTKGQTLLITFKRLVFMCKVMKLPQNMHIKQTTTGD